MIEPWYATRRDVKEALEAVETQRSNLTIDRALGSASQAVNAQMHRKFYPWTGTKYFPWPDGKYSRPWRLWLEQHGLISVTELSSGTTIMSPSLYNLEPVNDGPPYDSVELRLDGPGSFGQSNNRQRDISITGVWGYQNDELNVGALPAQLNAGVLSFAVSGATAARLSVGSLLRVDAERMIVVDMRLVDTTVNLATPVIAESSVTAIAVADGTLFAVGEDILLDSELMRIVDIAGNNLIVIRAWDGSVLADHSGSDIYARRTVSVLRAQLGTTDAIHVISSAMFLFTFPSLIRDLCIAEAVSQTLQESAGYARMAGAGENAREMSGKGLNALRAQANSAHGRHARIGAI